MCLPPVAGPSAPQWLSTPNALSAWSDFADKPTVGSFTKATVKTALIGAKSTVVGVISAVADLTGLTDVIFKGW